jgi:hypothetical protein
MTYAGAEGELSFTVTPAADRVWAEWSHDTKIKEANDVTAFLAGPILGGLLRLRGVLSLHASVVHLRERAVLLIGERRAGKSTIAAALAQRGHAILSDDVAAVTPDTGAGWLVHAGYPRLRLRPDAFHATAPVDAGPVMTGQDKRYVALSSRPDARAWRFHRGPLPVSGVFELRRDPERVAPTVERVRGADRLALLLGHTRAALAPLDPAAQARELKALSRFGEDVKMSRVCYPNGLEHTAAICSAIVSEAPSASP